MASLEKKLGTLPETPTDQQPVIIDDPQLKANEEEDTNNTDNPSVEQHEALLKDVKRTYYLRRDILSKELKIKSADYFDDLEYQELKSINEAINAILYSRNNEQFMGNIFTAINSVVARIFSIDRNQLDHDQELRNTMITSPIGNIIFNYIPPLAMPVVRYGLTILKLKTANKSNPPPKPENEQQDNSSS